MVIVREFREFAMRGNAVDMAVGIVIGSSFGRIVSSIVADIIMPPIGILIGGIDFSDLSITLKQAVGDSAAVTVNYGSFIKTVVDFVIIALVIFLVVHVMNVTRRKEEPLPAPSPQPSAEEKLLVEIRDLLKQR